MFVDIINVTKCILKKSKIKRIKRKKNKGYATGEVVRSRSEWIKHRSL